jgi:hypothetical protein
MRCETILITAISLMTIINSSCANLSGPASTHVTSTSTDSNEILSNSQGKIIPLFDGKTLNGWHAFNKPGKVTNWKIADSCLVCLGAAEGDTGGHIVSDREYGNFELSLDWKIEQGGNSGVMYHVIEAPNYKAPYETGPEYQMIDDEGYPDKLEDWQKTGADYAMNLPNEKKKLKPVGEWNFSKIIYHNGHVEHWLNGEKIVEFQSGDEKWMKQKQEGKWKDYPDYGMAKKGRIALQDHGKKAYFRNITIIEL